MIDFHSHVLPGIDDGSRSKEESISMLSEQKRQGAGTVVATPHFYASKTTPEAFLQNRQAAFDSLRDTADELEVDLRLGAEVLYFEGVRNYSALKDFCISGTELFLLEMPFTRWSERLIRDVVDLNSGHGLTVVLAHIDRYFRAQPSRTWEILASQGVLMQVNAEFFINRATRRKAVRLFQKGFVQFIGSDCHNMESRPPNVGAATDVIKKALGAGAVAYLQDIENEWFHNKRI